MYNNICVYICIHILYAMMSLLMSKELSPVQIRIISLVRDKHIWIWNNIIECLSIARPFTTHASVCGHRVSSMHDYENFVINSIVEVGHVEWHHSFDYNTMHWCGQACENTNILVSFSNLLGWWNTPFFPCFLFYGRFHVKVRGLYLASIALRHCNLLLLPWPQPSSTCH